MLTRQIMKPYWAVLQTYLQRPLFQWLAVACMFWPLAPILDQVRWWLKLPSPPDAWYLLEDVLGSASRECLPILFGVAWASHVRDQIVNGSGRLMPGYWRPHHLVATLMLAFVAVAVPLAFWAGDIGRWNVTYSGGHTSWHPDMWALYSGGVLVSVTLVVVAACSATFGPPWVSVILAPLLLVASLASNLEPGRFYYNLYYLISFNRPILPATWRIIVIATVAPIALDAVLIAVLGWRVRRLAWVAFHERTGRAAPSTIVDVARRSPLSTAWERVRHRRSPFLSGFAPWLVGGVVMLLLLTFPPLLYDHANPSTQLQVSLILVTVLPAVAVGCIWAERWPRLAAESLLPATRRQFVAETALAVGVDLASFWAAIAAGVTVPLVLFPAEPTDWRTLAARLGASAAVQAVALAAVLWGLVLRSWPALATLLGIALMAMAGPLLIASKRVPMVPIATLVPVSLVMAGVGCACVALARRRLLRGNLA